jgi:hypothetical protein
MTKHNANVGGAGMTAGAVLDNLQIIGQMQNDHASNKST